jgi:hypothetical protein
MSWLLMNVWICGAKGAIGMHSRKHQMQSHHMLHIYSDGVQACCEPDATTSWARIACVVPLDKHNRMPSGTSQLPSSVCACNTCIYGHRQCNMHTQVSSRPPTLTSKFWLLPFTVTLENARCA